MSCCRPPDEARVEPAAGKHPLAPLLEDARQGLQRIQNEVRDYSCVLVKRERIDGRLMPREMMTVKVRHEQLEGDRVVVPFSVYLRFSDPEEVEGREVLYVEAQNDGKMIVRKGGRRLANLTLAVSPDSPLRSTEIASRSPRSASRIC